MKVIVECGCEVELGRNGVLGITGVVHERSRKMHGYVPTHRVRASLGLCMCWNLTTDRVCRTSPWLLPYGLLVSL